MKQKFIVRIGAFVFNEKNELLILKNVRNTWGIIGGHLENGESLTEGLLREIKEETAINVNIVDLIDCQIVNDNLFVIYCAKTSEKKSF